MRISREYRVWPLYAREANMIYAIGRDESTGQPIDLSDMHSRLGRMAYPPRALSDATVLALVLAENSAGVAAALTEALSVADDHDEPQGIDRRRQPAPPCRPTIRPRLMASRRAGTRTTGRPAARRREVPTTRAGDAAAAPLDTGRRHSGGDGCGRGSPAAVLHTDALWLSDGTRVDLSEPITHVGQVAELAYTHNIGYQITPKFAEPGQIWITDEACRAVGIDVDSVAHRDRAKSLRQLTEGIDFVTLAVAEVEPGRCW